ncbi:hypothetical protein KGQ90_03740 [Modicisalibacter tunisiensis]|uniref:hypothetical protein n=1 Tax=Modicisalibacter tunisiensis TaxID=390637 RepID=UPI001CCB2865|nr:hypothetical protein [Modicisalibacter tunisiensis]MBZ9538056.1 hypothetical protein [Modicisalibacter tunisiensis]
MGGIFGGRNLQGSRCQARSAATSLLHVDGMRAVLMAWEGTLLGGTYNLRGGDSLDHFSDTDVALVVHGTLRHEGVELKPRALANRYSAVGISGLLGSDGTYAVALWDRRQDRLWLFTDPLGTQPLCYSRHDGGLAFGPEAKVVLGLLRRTARMDRQSALQFTANRYLLDTRTLFEGVYRLRPGECLSYDARRDEILLERYWDMRYGSDITQTDEAVTLLHDCLVDSHREMLSELAAGDRYTLFLTGGLDSRGILGLTHRLGRPPDQALTWAAHADLPDADPDIGRRLADMAMVPFGVCPLDGTDWLTHARDWCRTSELLSDNASSFATPVDFFSRWQVDGNRFVVLGDEAFGAGSMPSSIDEAAYNILRDAYRNIEGPLQQLLSVDAHEAAKQTLDGDIAGLIAGGPNSSPKDIQDYLYFLDS